MSTENTITALHRSEFSWIRCEGKGSFLNSPQLKDWAEADLATGTTTLVVDLEQCTGMDSTFMGTLAGLAMRLMKLPNGKLQIAGAGEKNRSSLEGLGLDVLMEIDPDSCAWKEKIDQIREELKPCSSSSAKEDQASHVLEAHKKLCTADQRNNAKFSTVLDYLEAEVEAKKVKTPPTDHPSKG
ncbi:MAG: STAS domain-containing protein [Akkermansiaceae bacterium]